MSVAEPRQMQFFRGPIRSHEQIADSTWEIGIECPELAKEFLPGQFAMLRIAQRSDAILGRAFAFWDRTMDSQGRPVGVKFVYLVKGRLTRPLSKMQVGADVEAWGPLGNAFSCQPVDHLVLVAGGVGQTPMLSVAQEALGQETFGTKGREAGYAKVVTLIYGARSINYLAGLQRFARVTDLDVRVTTEDGSYGRKGRVTDELSEMLQQKSSHSVRIQCCGPEPMMQAISEIAARHNVDCQVSLETPMACGIGICYTCVAKIHDQDGNWDYRRTCIEGPIFESEKVCWH